MTWLFTVARGSRKVSAAGVSRRDMWVKCNFCFIFVFRKYIHEFIAQIFPNALIVAYRKDKPLKDLVVRARTPASKS